jgi:hypothetical protein
MEYAFFAERYHWTPDQVDSLPIDFLDLAPTIAMARDRAQEIVNERARRQAERRHQ